MLIFLKLIIVFIVTLLLIFLFYASYNINSGVYIKTLCRNKKKGRVVSLTFDDGPDTENTARVLDVLKAYNITACFFYIGNKIKNNQSVVKRTVDEGHLIGNHSYSHLFSFPLHSSRWIIKDIEKCETELGVNRSKLFRPPFGVTNPMIAKAINKLGLATIGWNIRSLDTCRSREKVLKRIEKKLIDGSVILLHDRLPGSDLLLKDIIELIKKENYDIVRIDELFDLKNN